MILHANLLERFLSIIISFPKEKKNHLSSLYFSTFVNSHRLQESILIIINTKYKIAQRMFIMQMQLWFQRQANHTGGFLEKDAPCSGSEKQKKSREDSRWHLKMHSSKAEKFQDPIRISKWSPEAYGEEWLSSSF